MPLRTLQIILVVAVVSVACGMRSDQSPYGRFFADILRRIDREYVEDVDRQRLFNGAINGLVRELDDHSAFTPRMDTARFEESLDQRFGGIGIEVEGGSQPLTVHSPIAGSPAHRAGLQAGDQILAIDGQPTAELELRQAEEMLRGRPGDPVVVLVRRPGLSEPLEIRIVRAEIGVDSVLGDLRREDGSWNYMLAGQDRVGYMRIKTFGAQTERECQKALEQMRAAGARGVIIDLRDNPGGLLNAAVGVCELFLESDLLIVSTRGRRGQTLEEHRSGGSGEFRDLPLVVLINEFSASASEIVAACLQDHGRAVIVGEKSFGKGTVQNVIPTEGGRSRLRLTIASYWRPSGKNIHRRGRRNDAKQPDWGVSPDEGGEIETDRDAYHEWLTYRRQRDIIVPPSPDGKKPADSPPDVERDQVLGRAIETLSKQFEHARM